MGCYLLIKKKRGGEGEEEKEIRRFRFRAANCCANLQVFLLSIWPLMSNLGHTDPVIVLFPLELQ